MYLACITFILGQKLELLLLHLKRKQNYVNMTKICKLCISLMTRQLTLRFGWPVQMTYGSIVNIKNGEIIFLPKSRLFPFKMLFTIKQKYEIVQISFVLCIKGTWSGFLSNSILLFVSFTILKICILKDQMKFES